MKSLANYLQNPQCVKLITQKHPKLCNYLLTFACEKVISGANGIGSSLDLTEERLFRMLKISCETSLSLRDLHPMQVTVKRNELEVLCGQDFGNTRLLIQSGYNIEAITEYF